MNITIENKKQKALELMKTLDIYKPYTFAYNFTKSNWYGIAYVSCHIAHTIVVLFRREKLIILWKSLQ